MLVKTEMLELIDSCYTKAQLEKIHMELIVPAISVNPDILNSSPDFERYYSSLQAPGNRPKGLYVGLMTGLLTEAAALKAFMKTQPDSSNRLLELLIWKGKVSAVQLYREYNILSVVTGGENPLEQPFFYSSRQEVETPFIFFPSNVGQVYKFNRLIFRLPFSIRRALQEFYPKPRDYDLKAAKPIYQTDFTYEDRGRILSLFPLIDLYHRQGNIKLTQNGRPQSTTLGKMQKTLRIREFFDNQKTGKQFANLRTHLLASLWLTGKPLGDYPEPLEQMKLLFEQFQDGSYKGVDHLLVHLKGLRRLEVDPEINAESMIWNLLPEMPVDTWVDADSFHNWFQYRGIDLRPISVGDASHSLYMTDKYGTRETVKKFIEPHTYDEGVLQPFIKASFFLFAAFGLVDVAYDLPDTREPGTSYFSPFDGLRYVRLTPLGAYLLGLRDNYSLPAAQPLVSVKLSQDALLMRVDGKQDGLLPVLENFARKISTTRFKVDYESFLKGCSDAADIETKIRLFEEQVSDSCPEIWNAFFSELRRKAKQLTAVQDTLVFRLQDTDRELASLIAQDEVLRGLVIKAEGFHIILQKRDLSRFKNRLKSFGYLL